MGPGDINRIGHFAGELDRNCAVGAMNFYRDRLPRTDLEQTVDKGRDGGTFGEDEQGT